jgi:NhaA family Na+:H+ antiporter
MLGVAGVAFAVLFGLNKAGVSRLTPYLLVGAVLWFFVLKSGIHATIAGVLLALTIPMRVSPGRPEDPTSPLHQLEHAIHPWTAFLILPIFGFANAGVPLTGFEPRMLLDPVTLGVALGLLLGKQLGVFGFVLAAVKLGLAQRPSRATWMQIYGVALLCGIGFTMSLFIGLLGFANNLALEAQTKIGVLAGSLTSMVLGALVLRFCPSMARPKRTPFP